MRCSTLQLADGTRIGRVWLAATSRERMRGLLGRSDLAARDLLLLDPCGSIHTLGMRFALDILFLDRAWRVVRVRHNVPPGRLVLGGWRARRTLEAATGWLDLQALTSTQFIPPSFADCSASGP